MKVAIFFLLSALTLLILAGNTTAKVIGMKANCPEKLVGCHRDYDPVCGTNGLTYANECTLCFENRKLLTHVRIQRRGPC